MRTRSTTAPTHGDTSTRFFKTLIGTTSIAVPKRCAGAKTKNGGFRQSGIFSRDSRTSFTMTALFRARRESRDDLQHYHPALQQELKIKCANARTRWIQTMLPTP